MTRRSEIGAVYAAGVVQGVALVTFPAASPRRKTRFRPRRRVSRAPSRADPIAVTAWGKNSPP